MLTQRKWSGLLLFVPLLAFGQSQNASISGTITDATGAVVPNAQLELTNEQRQVSMKTASASNGLYSFPNLVPGTYDLKVDATGFKSVAQKGISLTINQLARVDVQLEVGTSVQTVDVEAAATQLNFESSARAEGVGPDTINELPLIVSGGPRNSAQFLVLLPGVSTGGGNNSFDARINGGMATGDEAIMDGASMQEGFMSQSGMVSFFDFRMTPDQFALDRQVQTTCDNAKFIAGRLTGKEWPAHPDTEQTFAELRQRIQKCLSFLETVQAKDLAGAEDRKVAPPWLGGKWLRADDYLMHVAIPNFFFHATMTYAILRHNGVELGKMDYVGSLPTKEG